MIKKITLLFYLFSLLTNAQNKYPINYFDAPLKIPIVLSGTFGELRSNHFHSGIDIKTLGKQGIPIYAPADGYVSRIKVAQYGFGKAIYLNHPNGYTTVYAHLKKYHKNIQNYVKAIQYKKQSYQTGNIFPKPEKFVIRKGDIIGYTGNSGSSGGPHLHYEIRNTKTEKIINPMHFGLAANDNKAPSINQLKVFTLDNNSRIENANQSITLNIKKISKGNYEANKINANGNIGFGVHVYDQLDAAHNKNGIYSLEMKANGQTMYYHDVETFSFAESKYINLLIDYSHYKKFRKRFQKTHKVNGNKLSIYKNLINNGKLYVSENLDYNIEIIAKDFQGNTSSLKFNVNGIKNNTILSQKDTTAYKVTPSTFSKFKKENITVAFPKNTFYNTTYLDIDTNDTVAKIHEPTIPLNKNFTLTFNTSNLSEQEKTQVYIANVTNKKYPYYVKTIKKENKVYTTSKTLGSYTLRYDNKKPKISLVNFKNQQWISKLTQLKIKISDKETGIKNWRATIDDQWVLMEYNHKKGILTYDFSDKKLIGSKHIFKIEVSDNVGNSHSKAVTFFRK